MPQTRKALVSLDATPYYQGVSRCVRRAFLCDEDTEGGDCSRRCEWIESLLPEQACVFCIDVAAFAVMSNHFHVVLFADAAEARSLLDHDVIQR